MNKISLTLLSLLFSFISSAQTKDSNSIMAETMRSNGKIYVVIAIIITILTGILVYLVKLDKKISSLEKEK